MNIGTEIKYSNQQQIAINVRQPQLDVQVVGPEKFILGDTKQYNITVTNRGDGVAHDVKLTGEFPKGLQKLKSSNTMLEQLAPGQSAQIVVQTQALESGTKKVAFKVESTELEPVTKNLDTLIVQPELQVTATGPMLIS